MFEFKLKIAILLIINVFAIASCGQDANVKIKPAEGKPPLTPAADITPYWSKVNAGFQPSAMGRYKDGLLLASDSAIATVDTNGLLKNLPSYKIKSETTTNDGGMTTRSTKSKEQYPGDERSFPYLCDPERIVSVSGDVWVLADCEHSKQLWKVSFENESTFLDVTNFIGESGPPLKPLVAPTDLTINAKSIITPVYLETGPALLSADSQSGKLKVIWKGNESDGGIVSVTFVADTGWIILGKGKILHSTDGGRNWTALTRLSSIPVEDVIDVKFLNSSEGYISAKSGQLLTTRDGGKTWQYEKVAKSDLRNTTISDNAVVICCDDTRLLVRKQGANGWTYVEQPSNQIVDSAVIGNKIFTLAQGDLYTTS